MADETLPPSARLSGNTSIVDDTGGSAARLDLQASRGRP
jgi:hypothetical protein